MNEKYIQAIILGSLIGGAILFDDYVKPALHNHQIKLRHLLKILK